MPQQPRVAVVIGSKSDEEVTRNALKIFEEFGLAYDFKVLSAHRNPEALKEYVEKSDCEVFIAVAGLAAHLPGAIAARTTRPVIGVPVSGKLGGLDALLSIVQMPRGVPVACVAIDGTQNAALLALEILALKDRQIGDKLKDYRARL
ncbi:MAG: 5-(carboxyamino)imidazole ribonucleotide mutase [Promethearchaeati archaeon SRVP18_Atabeyarchaeia-1]